VELARVDSSPANVVPTPAPCNHGISNSVSHNMHASVELHSPLRYGIVKRVHVSFHETSCAMVVYEGGV
jgi:hypothetical protein